MFFLAVVMELFTIYIFMQIFRSRYEGRFGRAYSLSILFYYSIKRTFGLDLTPGSSRFSNAPGPTDGNVV